MDGCAGALLVADKMLADGKLETILNQRYASWNAGVGKDILGGKISLEALVAQLLSGNCDPRPVSGRQECLENLLNSYL